MWYYAGLVVFATVVGGSGEVATNIMGQDSSVTASVRARVPFTMQGSIEPGGEVMSFEGTIQEIESQIRQSKPDFTWDQFQPARLAPRAEKKSANSLARRDLVAVTCPDERDLGFGDRRVLEDAYDYFQNYTMDESAPLWQCSQFWNGNDSQVLLCNSDIRSWEVIGENLATVIDGILSNDTCKDPGDPGRVQGEASFEGGAWSVVFGGCNGSCTG